MRTAMPARLSPRRCELIVDVQRVVDVQRASYLRRVMVERQDSMEKGPER